MPENPWEVISQAPATPKPAILNNPYEVTGTTPLPTADTGPRPAKTTVGEDVTSMLPAAGAIGLTMAAGPAGAGLAGVLLGGLGGAGGEAFKQIANRIMGAPAPATGDEAGMGIFKTGAEQTLLGGAFELGATGLAKIAAPGAKKFASPAVQEFMALAKKHGVAEHLTPGEVLDSQVLKGLEWVGSLTTHSRKMVQVRSAKAVGAAAEAAKNALDEFGAQQSNLIAGDTVKKTIVEKVGDAFRAKKSELYQAVDDAAGNAEVVDTKPIAALVEKKLLAEAKMMQKYPGTFKRSPELVEMMTDFLTPATAEKLIGNMAEGSGLTTKKIVAMMPLNAAKTETFTGADQLRSKWLERGRESGKKDVIEFAAQAERLIEEQIQKGGASLGPDVYPKLQTARDFYRNGKQLMNGAVYNSVLKRAPEDVAAAIAPGDTTALRDLKQAVVNLGNNPKAFDGFRRQWVSNQIGDDITKLPQAMAAWGKEPEFKNEMFGDLSGKIVLKNLNEVSDILGRMSQTSKSLGFQRLQEAHNIVNVAADMSMGRFSAVPMAARALFLPSIITKVVHTPGAMKYFTVGLSNVGKDTGLAVTNISRAFSIALKGVKAIEDTND